MHMCPRCGRLTAGSYSAGGLKWAICDECMQEEEGGNIPRYQHRPEKEKKKMKAKLIYSYEEGDERSEIRLYVTEEGQYVEVYDCPSSYHYSLLEKGERIMMREGEVEYNKFPYEII